MRWPGGTPLVDIVGFADPIPAPDSTVGFSPEPKDTVMADQPIPARERVRGTVPKMIELSEQIIYGDIWERPDLASATAA